MKPLLAILSCGRDRALELLQTQMFLGHWPQDYRFFHGSGVPEFPNSVTLDVADDFHSLPFKTQAMCRWVLKHDYDYVFKMDTDTYLRPERLLASEFQKQGDYSGYFSYEPSPGAYASGGSGYWLSRKSLEVVSASNAFFRDMPNPENTEKSFRGEDLQVCWVLQAEGIHCHKDERYCLRNTGPLAKNDRITLHDVCIANKRHRLEVPHAAWLASGGKR